MNSGTMLGQIFLLATTLGVGAAQLDAQNGRIVGRWDASVGSDSGVINFPLEISGTVPALVASFFNGERRISSTRVEMRGDSVVFSFDYLATQLTVNRHGDSLVATYRNTARTTGQRLTATPAREHGDTAAAPDIAGVWVLPAESTKGEHAWRLIVRQTGSRVYATILRVDGDAGLHQGVWNGRSFQTGLFDGARTGRIDLTLLSGGHLVVRQVNSRGTAKSFEAVRAERAIAEGLPLPADFSTHTRMRNPDERLHFAFPDLSGRMVSDSDQQFRNKVVLVNIAGSWCPNCHDEAPFLAELYREWHDKGLEIVSLAFEERDQLANPVRLKAFLRQYEIDYTCLLVGEPGELQARLPQFDQLDSWPTTFFVGRDGRVRAVHAGFATEASGEFHLALRAEMKATIARLLAEPGP